MTSQPRQSKDSRVNTRWFRDLRDQKSKEDFEKMMRNDKVVLGRLKEIIEDLIVEIETKEIDNEDFDTPNWAFKQASRLGEKRGLKKVKDLLIFIDGE